MHQLPFVGFESTSNLVRFSRSDLNNPHTAVWRIPYFLCKTALVSTTNNSQRAESKRIVLAGRFGLFEFLSELSRYATTSTRVPRGNVTGSLNRYSGCQSYL